MTMNNGVLWKVTLCSNLSEEIALCIRRKDGGSNFVYKVFMPLSECKVSRLRKSNFRIHWYFPNCIFAPFQYNISVFSLPTSHVHTREQIWFLSLISSLN